MYCPDCGKALGSSSPCKYCSWANTPEKLHINAEIEKRNKVKVDYKHHYRYYKPADMINFNACHNCKYFMYHSIRWCYKCGQEIIPGSISVKELQEKYPDYKRGY